MADNQGLESSENRRQIQEGAHMRQVGPVRPVLPEGENQDYPVFVENSNRDPFASENIFYNAVMLLGYNVRFQEGATQLADEPGITEFEIRNPRPLKASPPEYTPLPTHYRVVAESQETRSKVRDISQKTSNIDSRRLIEDYNDAEIYHLRELLNGNMRRWNRIKWTRDWNDPEQPGLKITLERIYMGALERYIGEMGQTKQHDPGYPISTTAQVLELEELKRKGTTPIDLESLRMLMVGSIKMLLEQRPKLRPEAT